MPRAVELRLRDALQEYIEAYSGDAGHMRSAQPDGQHQLVAVAGQLLNGIGGGARGRTGSDSPGRRAAIAAGLDAESSNQRGGLTPGQRVAGKPRPSAAEAFDQLAGAGAPGAGLGEQRGGV